MYFLSKKAYFHSVRTKILNNCANEISLSNYVENMLSIRCVEKPEVLTIPSPEYALLVNFRIPRYSPGQSESARSGQLVRFFRDYLII